MDSVRCGNYYSILLLVVHNPIQHLYLTEPHKKQYAFQSVRRVCDYETPSHKHNIH